MPNPLTRPDSLQRFALWWRTAIGRPLADALLTQACALCNRPAGHDPICGDCAKDLPTLPATRCECCALPLTGGLAHCLDCARHPPHFDSACAVWTYDFPIDTLIRDFKYGHHLYLGRFFADHLAQALKRQWAHTGQPHPDLIVPMPLHPNRLKTRGFNQAAEIARLLAVKLDMRCDFGTLNRLHDTPPQAGLHRDERWHNLLGAFACLQPLSASHVLLVDDVLTTGASLSACADALRQAGAARIDVAVVARTPTPDATHHLKR